MNDKFKGLVLGLTLGTMLTGSAVYAAGASQIEVVFREIKYLFDGVEKQPTAEQGQSFIYNGTTYVPLRFVSEALGEKVEWDGDNNRIWIGKKLDYSAVIATYKGGQLTYGELDRYMNMEAVLSPGSEGYKEQPEYQENIAKRIISIRILSSRLSEADRAALQPKVDEQFSKFKEDFAKSGGDLAALLAAKGLEEKELRGYFEGMKSVEAALKAGVTDESLKAAYDAKLKEDPNAFTTASVRHILIGLTDGQGKTIRTKEEAKKKADELTAKLRAGGDFAKLAKENTEDPGSKDTGGLYENAPVSSWVEAFKKAAVELELNKISDPVETEYGYHVMRVESRTVRTFDQLKNELAGDALQPAYNQFIEKELPALIEKLELPKEEQAAGEAAQENPAQHQH
ncbi:MULTISPECIES: peptidylprolyl isomerase [Paenibacillus]|uniref:peptidylprolyl isomerase n=1 Tax=Paenibacillus TaxID=44249 RepID=UPI0022B928DA|nr:peptidylprolyl isomerase [Paenibacillus caseinilyticus]MCZ8521433.1 peptidylprolyl isomerase [Paenibacillus caseinilyticus]